MVALVTTQTFWDVNGTELNRYCWNIETLGGGRSSVPKFRGDNTTLAYRPGSRHEAKTADARILPLRMWVSSLLDTGVEALVRDEQYEANLRALRGLFWRDDAAQVPLTKRWREGGAILSATALVELVSDMAPTMAGPFTGSLDVDLLLADPWFYTAQQTVNVPVSGTPTVVNNTGDARTTGYGCQLEFVGPLTNPQLTNGSVWVKVGTSIATGDKVTLDLWDWTALRDLDGANLIGAVQHSGARQWMPLEIGANSLVLSVSSGTGSVNVKYRLPRF